MAERKALSFYYPPGMDPSAVPKRQARGRGGRKKAAKLTKVRLAMPFTAACTECKNLIGMGKRLLVRKETVAGETYLGVPVTRFYCRCPECAAEFTFKTDPKSADFAVERGLSRLHTTTGRVKPLRELLDDAGSDGDDGVDPMEALEARAAASRREIEDLERLEDLRQMKAAMATVDAGAILTARRAAAAAEAAAGAATDADADAIDPADEARLAAIFAARRASVKRLDDAVSTHVAADAIGIPEPPQPATGHPAVPRRDQPPAAARIVVRAAPKRKLEAAVPPAHHAKKRATLASLVAGGSSDSESESEG